MAYADEQHDRTAVASRVLRRLQVRIGNYPFPSYSRQTFTFTGELAQQRDGRLRRNKALVASQRQLSMAFV